MKFAVAYIVSFLTLAYAAPGYKSDNGATVWGSFKPGPYACALTSISQGTYQLCGATDTRCLCQTQSYLDDWFCCMSKPSSHCSNEDRDDAWQTFTAQCAAYGIHLTDHQYDHAKSAAAASSNIAASNTTNVPTVGSPSNATATTSALATPSEATGAGVRSTASLAIMGAAIAGAIVMFGL